MMNRQNQQQQQHGRRQQQQHHHGADFADYRHDDPWLHRSFLKDTKMRVRERYWRNLHCENNLAAVASLSSSLRRYIIIPDALTWRKYLPWIETILTNTTDDDHDDDSTSRSSSVNKQVVWYLLESVVENMDYRNQSPVIKLLDNNNNNKTRESTVPQERSTLLKLFRQEEEEQSSSAPGRRLQAFCDLSFRSSNNADDDDEWDFLHYEKITTEERSRHAIVRAAQMIQDCYYKKNHDHDDDTDNDATTRMILLLVEDDDDDNDESNQDQQQEEAEGGGGGGIPVIRRMKIHDLLDLWRNDGLVDEEQYERYCNLLQSSHDNYVRRNTPKLIAAAPSTENDDDEDDDWFVPEQEEEYWSDERIQQGLDQKKLIKGRLEVTKENPREAFVVVSADQQQQHDDDGSIVVKHYFIDANRGHFNRALHQDTVILQPLPKKAWGYPVGKRRLVIPTSDLQDNDKELDNATTTTVSSSSSSSSSSQQFPSFPSARVVAIANPTARRRNIVATLVDVPVDVGESSALLVVPMDVCIPKIRLVGSSNKSWHKYVGKRLLVDLIHPANGGWPVTSRYPQGYCRDILGPVGDIETEIACLLYENQIDFALQPFSLAAQACLPTLTKSGQVGDDDDDDAGAESLSWTIPHQEIAQRRDLRDYCIFSVDPPGCQDIDDTMHARLLPNGQVEIGVHIADVTYFVPQGSALDREAQVRGTTFYLVDRRFDMLPSLLSSNLCSLHGGTDRLAVSVIWTLSSDLCEVVSTWFGRTIIHNVAAMMYDQADNILQGKSPEEPGSKKPPPLTAGSPVDRALIPTLREHLALLTQVARQRRQQREEIGGAVDLSSSGGSEDENVGSNELKFNLVNGEPVAVKPKQDKEIHHTIAELMIWANTSVATKIYESFPNSALLRVHQAVEEDRFEDLQQMLKAANITTGSGSGASGGDGITSNRALAQTLQLAQRKATAVVQALFRSLATRAMSEALYVSSGEQRKRMAGQQQQQSDFAHYGLGLEIYTHFTSPIRRYADVVVHVQLLAALEQEKKKASDGGASQMLVIADQRKPLESLPKSEVVSVLAGDLLRGADEGDDEDDLIDALIDGAADQVLEQATPETSIIPAAGNDSSNSHQSFEPYEGSRVGTICQHLNLHNRLAKRSSMDCQSLFLSLYFRHNVEIVQGVVTTIRENGFFCYVPKFDMRAPVFLKDVDGCIQMNPSFFGLASNAGEEPTRGFVNSAARRFRSGGIDYVPDEKLTVSVEGGSKTLTFKPLDVVSVQISCTDWDQRARVPLPRLQLIVDNEQKQQHKKANDLSRSINSEAVKIEVKSLESMGGRRIHESLATNATLYDVIRRQSVKPTVEAPEETNFNHIKENLPERQHGFTGRFVYGSFVNPDTRSAQQEAAQEAAAAESAARRATLSGQAAASRGGQEYTTVQRIEREVTSRQQRLHAEKRNTRRAKAK